MRDGQKLLLGGAAALGALWLLTRGSGMGGANCNEANWPMVGGLVQVPQSCTRSNAGVPYGVGQRVLTPNGRSGVVVPG